MQAGVVISNSEVGLGSVNIQPLIYRLVCSNGMVVNDAATKRNHIGQATDAEENFQLYSEKTLAADDHAFLLKVQDTVRAAAEEEYCTDFYEAWHRDEYSEKYFTASIEKLSLILPQRIIEAE